MKITLALLTILITFSCNQMGNMTDIKDGILYKDSHDNIYLKREIDIMSERYPQQQQSRFFDLVLYKDSAYQLKKIIDPNTFRFVKSVTDTVLINKTDYFEDSKHVYYFQYLPPTSPEIKAIDK